MTTLPPFPQGDVGFANAVTKHLRAVSPLHCLTAEAAGTVRDRSGSFMWCTVTTHYADVTAYRTLYFEYIYIIYIDISMSLWVYVLICI